MVLIVKKALELQMRRLHVVYPKRNLENALLIERDYFVINAYCILKNRADGKDLSKCRFDVFCFICSVPELFIDAAKNERNIDDD